MKRLGIIGYGGMAAYHHDCIQTKLDGAIQVVAAHDVDPERLALAKEKDSSVRVYDNLQDFLADDGIDMVLVATPNNFHCDLAVAAMERGLHVVCEKPVAMNLAELDKMIETANKNNVLFTVHQNRRWDHDYRSLRKSIEDGNIGKPYSIESRVHGSLGACHGWRGHKVAGGGMLLDWGVHLIDQILDMWPPEVATVDTVFCAMHAVKVEEVDDYFKLIMKMSNGCTVHIEVGTYCLVPMKRWYAYGDHGAIAIDGWDRGKVVQAIETEMKWEPVIVQTAAGPTRTMAPRPKETLNEFETPEIVTEWSEFYKNVAAAVDGNKEDAIVKHAQVRRVFQVIEAAFLSHETNASVTLNI